jgi:hypothetical protein
MNKWLAVMLLGAAAAAAGCSWAPVTPSDAPVSDTSGVPSDGHSETNVTSHKASLTYCN